MSLQMWMIADAVLLIIILWKLISGIRNGAVHMLGGVASLGCGIFAGRLCQSLFADTVAKQWLEPGIRKLLDAAKERLGVQDLPANLGEIMKTADLPSVLKLDVVQKALERMKESSGTAVANATELIAQRVAGWILFLIALLVVTLLVRILFTGVIEPLIDKLPLVNEANRILGGVLGAAQGILIAGLVLLICSWLLPGLWENAKEIFSPESIERSYIMKLYYELLPNTFYS